jgi:hypothetical protein
MTVAWRRQTLAGAIDERIMCWQHCSHEGCRQRRHDAAAVSDSRRSDWGRARDIFSAAEDKSCNVVKYAVHLHRIGCDV